MQSPEQGVRVVAVGQVFNGPLSVCQGVDEQCPVGDTFGSRQIYPAIYPFAIEIEGHILDLFQRFQTLFPFAILVDFHFPGAT